MVNCGLHREILILISDIPCEFHVDVIIDSDLLGEERIDGIGSLVLDGSTTDFQPHLC